ncbi:hypothetical protein AB0L88_28505 [Saccharopolyspora shandongensis]|uniref:hypothetical protein n=1 Tax=Saccharopolyspora shandongensis TaxID=418495 RepID=UPI00341471D8
MQTTEAPPTRKATRFMYAGLALTAIATLAPLLDIATVDALSAHVREAYPNWPEELIAMDRNAIAGYLATIGVLGTAGWLWTIRGAKKQTRWSRAASTALFALGATTALMNLTLTGGEYANVIPPLHATLGALPAIAGLATITVLWRGKSPTNPEWPTER